MPNTSEYRVIVKGRKNACYAFYGSMSNIDEKGIGVESGDEEDYTLKFQGYCEWDVDSDCGPWDGDFPVTLPEDYLEAEREAEDKYRGIIVQERSKLFEVEVWCNSMDIDDPEFYTYEHYNSGKPVLDLCPEELEFEGQEEMENSDPEIEMVLDLINSISPEEISEEYGVDLDKVKEILETAGIDYEGE